MSQDSSSSAVIRLGSYAVIGVGVISLLTAAYFSSGERLTRQTIPATSAMIGPIQITEPGTVLEITVQQALVAPSDPYGGGGSTWSFVGGEVLDDEHEYLFGFGGELWAESGFDGSYWTESDTTYDLKVTMPEAGTYYLGFNTESDPNIQPNDITVTIDRKRGSAIPHFVLGLVGVVFGFFMSLIASKPVQAILGGA